MSCSDLSLFPSQAGLVVLHGFMEHLGEFWGFSYPDFKDIHHESRSLVVAAWTFTGGTISAPGEPEYVDSRQISADLFPTLGISPFMDAPSAPMKIGLVQRRWR